MINNILEEHPDIIRSEALDSLLSDDNKLQKVEITEDRIKARIKEIRDYVAFWREYPDYFIDFMKGPNSKFELFPYQRIMLRTILRHRYVYATFPRA